MMVDWKSVLIRYIDAVTDDDLVVGIRCLSHPIYCPKWTKEENEALRELCDELSERAKIHREALEARLEGLP